MEADRAHADEVPQCSEYKLPHQVCGNCGYYKGKGNRENGSLKASRKQKGKDVRPSPSFLWRALRGGPRRRNAQRRALAHGGKGDRRAKGTPAQKLGLSGCTLLSIDGNEINDMLDYEFYSQGPVLELAVVRGAKLEYVRAERKSMPPWGASLKAT